MSELSGRPVLVTGAGGFIGSHLTEELVRVGARVRAAVRYNSRGSRGALEWADSDLVAEAEVVALELRDPESTRAAVAGSEIVFHLAAQIAIPYSYVNPRDFAETNVLGTLNISLACLEAGVECLVNTSTSEVYGTAQQVPITEEHPLCAQSPYAASKIGADQLALSLHRSHGLPVCVVRPFNTYGPRQSARAVIPTIISQALRGDVVRLGSITPTRDLTFVRDTCTGFVAAAGTGETIGRVVQLGSGKEMSIAGLVDAVGDALGKKLTIVQEQERVRPDESEVDRLVSSPRRMTELTGWKAAWSLEEGLAETIRWIEANLGLFRAGAYAV